MSCHVTRIKDCLADWIDGKMPSVGGVRSIEIKCCDELPFEWLPGNRSNIKAITLWSSIYLRNRFCPVDPCDRTKVELLLHELVHVEQFRDSPILFPIKYLFNLIWHGYWNNPAEIEARARSSSLIQAYSLEDPCHCSVRPAQPLPEIVEMIKGTPPEKPPRELLPEEIENCCRNDRDNLTIKWQATRTWQGTGSDIHFKVWAESACGVRELSTKLMLVQRAGDQTLFFELDRAVQKNGCKTYSLKEYQRFVAPPASLIVEAEATSCCGKKVKATAGIGA